MGGYTKNIAVIKGLKDGFSSDGGSLTGLVKAERYGSNLRVEVTFINFAPLSEGRYVTAVSDGKSTLLVEDGLFEGSSALDTSQGFAALVCFVNGQVSPIAAAICGSFHEIALDLRREVERAENVKVAGAPKSGAGETAYEDEAIAEVNYYEFAKTDEGGGAVRADTQKEENGRKLWQDEAAVGAFKEEQGGVSKRQKPGGENTRTDPLARGGAFFERMQGEIDGILSAYPHETALEKLIKGSKWVKIDYGDGRFYVFGIISASGKPRYICYGVPAQNGETPPESMRGLASFIPGSEGEAKKGYWVMYQDAQTGASIKVDIN